MTKFMTALILLTSGTGALAAAPQAAKLVASCCAAVAACCGIGLPCCD